ncbi:MAG: hypothetical protein ABGY75_08120 [Gemmataceae bacterium]
MTESQWLKSKDGDAMLALVAARLSERQWMLLGCNVIRRVWDLLPDDGLKEELDKFEHLLAAGREQMHFPNFNWDAIRRTVRQDQADILKSCSSDPVQSHHENPLVPLDLAACESARLAVGQMEEAAEYACQAVQPLTWVHGERHRWGFSIVLDHVRTAKAAQSRGTISAALALELKARSDELADRVTPRNARLLVAQAEEMAQTLGDRAEARMDKAVGQVNRAENLALARLLREQLGNPFRPYRFEDRWRTETVVALATGIEAERAFDRLPILADAVEEAGCDEEAVLRHCRGPEPHARGCWVIDLILNREPGWFAAEPIESRKRPQGRSQRMGPFRPPPENMM